MNNLSDKIIEKIEKEGISPKPKWEFLLKDGFLWGGFVFSVLMGAVSISVILFFVKTGDLDIYKAVYGSFFSAVASVIPFFWVLLLLAFSVFSYLNFRKTERGYKINFLYVVLSSVVLSVVFGALLFQFGTAKWLHSQLTLKIPFYERFQPRHEMRWMKPSEGLLIGVVSEFESDFALKLIDLDRKIWLVNYEKAKLPKRFRPEISTMIKILGKKMGEGEFDAFEIRPLERPIKGLKKNFLPRF